MEYGFGDFAKYTAYEMGLGMTAYSSLSSGNQTLISSIINSAYFGRIVRPPLLPGMRRAYEWSFLRPIHTINAWPSASTTLDGPNTTQDKTSTVSGAHDATTTVTLADAILASWMEGETITIDAVANTIVSVTSTTVCVVQNAITESGGEAVTVDVTKVTVDAALFYDNMADGDDVVTIGSTDYTILSVSSTTVCYVSGDASSEADLSTTSVTTTAEYRLPADYGGLSGPLTHAAASGYPPVQIINETELRRLRRWSSGTGVATLAAIRPLTPSQTATQEFDLLIYPTPDQNYPLTFRYSVRLSEFDNTTNTVFPGAADHSMLILQACYAVAEERLNGVAGPANAKFLEMLAAAIDFDKQAHGAEHYGIPPGGPSVSGGGLMHGEDFRVTVGGVQY